MKILVIDVGGTHVKVLASGHQTPIKIPSGARMTPRAMVKAVIDATAEWTFDAISIGYPGPVVAGRPARDPWNLGRGWVGFDFKKAFKRPVRIINDAAMQALGSYEGGSMLFLGLGTGLGSAMVRDGDLIPLELAHLPYRKGKTYEEYLGEAGYLRLGRRAWQRHVAHVTALFTAAFVVDYIVLGGGNSRHLHKMPPGARLGSNSNAFKGGYRLWRD
ncbi:MAG TPA: ROK family protein [Gemmatimonadaceae bacterium]|jgi:predicted NBD/HSP70 family sugar kinase|nr:ROK family protein [Gemmatimonadaceae bacterium]